jgi:Domain of unknown function (DUF4412)
MKRTVTAILCILAIASFASADIYVKSKVHTDPMSVMGQSQPAKDSFSEQWIGTDKFAMLSDKTASVIDLGKNVMYIINHTSKTYIEAPLPFDFTSLLPAQMATMMQGMMKMTVTVNPTGVKKTIGSWACDEYDVTMNMMMMPMKMKVYATTDVPFDLAAYMSKIYGTVLKSQFRLDDASVSEMMKVKGFWISSETTMEMMGSKIRTTTEVVEISQKTPPAGAYGVPAGYTKQDKLSMQDLQNK